MKHKILLFAALLTIAGACSKEKPAEKAAELYPVRFNLSGLGVEYAPITKAGTTPPVTFVKYLIMQGSNILEQKTLTISSAEDLAVQMYVPAGESSVYFAAGGQGATSSDSFSLEQYGSAIIVKGDYIELFAATTSVDPEAGSNYGVELQRITGAIELQILDADKAAAGQEITSFGVTFENKPVYYSLSTGTTAEGKYESNLFAKGNVSNGTGIISVLPASEQNLFIELYTGASSTTKLYNSYTITAAVYKNRKTIIKGNVYGGTPNFTITIAEGWGENNEVVF